jgi:hypothetical protein
MTTEKETEIINALQGITYKDWELLRNKIDLVFDKKAASQKEQLTMAAPELIAKPYYELQEMLLENDSLPLSPLSTMRASVEDALKAFSCQVLQSDQTGKEAPE